MKIETLEQLEPLLKRRTRILETLYHLEETKAFLKLTINGENGNEQPSSVSFTWENESTIPERIRLYMLEVVEAELKEVETLIEAIN